MGIAGSSECMPRCARLRWSPHDSGIAAFFGITRLLNMLCACGIQNEIFMHFDLVHCANDRFCNGEERSYLRGCLNCTMLLHLQSQWRYIYAMLIGYARVSSNDQETYLQVAALKAAGCERIFREKASGGRWDRPELHRLLDQLRKGDVIVIWKLDRLSRSLRDVLLIMERMGEANAGFRSLTEAIDTTTPAGRMMMQMVGAFAEFERAMLRERTKAGLDAARREGRIGGRRPKLTMQQQAEIIKTVSKGDKTAADAARLFKVHPATVSRLLARTSAK
jgi:DNA invertase Pin-like site-specific DNA recombinase